MNMKLGFIGAGNMAGAIMKRVLDSGFQPAQDVIIYDTNQQQCRRWKEAYPDICIAKNNCALVKSAECIILAVKPVFLRDVLQEIRAEVRGKSFISIVSGWSNGMLYEFLNEQSGARVLRVMPNTPAMVGEGYTAICQEHTLDADMYIWAQRLFGMLGKAEIYPQRLFDAVTAVSGSSPAYAYMMIEAMADGAVRLGIPRASAYQAAAQAMLGAAKMVLETGQHPGKLKDDVCSPGGTTIEAVYTLEEKGFRGAVMDAMFACAQKSQQVTEQSQKNG